MCGKNLCDVCGKYLVKGKDVFFHSAMHGHRELCNKADRGYMENAKSKSVSLKQLSMCENIK